MGRWFSTLLLVIVIILAAVLIVPSFIDWTMFRPTFERAASRLAHREVTIDGKIGLRLLPSPHLSLGDITIADPKAPKAPLVSAGNIQATAAWLPLLEGKIKFTSLGLVEPIVRITIHKDGTTNWSVKDPRFARRRPPRVHKLREAGLASLAALQDFKLPHLFTPQQLSFTNLWIQSGTLFYADERNGAQDRIDQITGKFDIESLQGPWSGQTGFVIDKQSLGFGFRIDKIVQGQPSPAALHLTFLAGNGKLDLTGTVAGAAEAVAVRRLSPLTFDGKFSLNANGAGPVAHGLAALVSFGTAPDARRPFANWTRVRSLPVTLKGPIRVTKSALTIANAQGALGRTRAGVSLVRGRGTHNFGLTVAADTVYLDDLVDTSKPGGLRLAPLSSVSGPLESLGSCTCNGKVVVTARNVMLGGASLSGLDFEAKLAPGASEITKATITLPGDTKLAGAGKLPPVGVKGGVIFNGTVNIKSSEPRALLQWLGVSTARLAPDALKSFALSGPFKLSDHVLGSAQGLRGPAAGRYVVPAFENDKLTLDGNSYQLTASYDESEPGSLVFRLAGDWLDADAYGIAPIWWPSTPLDSESWQRTLWARAVRAGNVDVDLKFATLRLAHRSITGFKAAVTRKAGGPAEAHVNIADIAGYKLAFTGSRTRPSGNALPETHAKLTVSGPGKPIHLPLAGKGLPGALALNVSLDQQANSADWSVAGTIGEIKLAATGTGPASTALLPDIQTLKATAHLSQGKIEAYGALRTLTSAPTFAGNITVDALDFPAFMRELGYSYEPRRKDLGALSIVGELTASPSRVDVRSLAASVGKQSLTATGTLDMSGARARLDGNIKAGRISLQGYLPAPPKGSSWSTERLKLDPFRRFDGAVHFTAERFEIGPYNLHTLNSTIEFDQGTVKTNGATATLFGGPFSFTGSARLTDEGPFTQFRANLTDFDWTVAAEKLFPSIGVAGKGDASVSLVGTASGRSLFQLVQSYAGSIDMKGKGGALQGFDLSAWGDGLSGVQSPESFLRLAKVTLGHGTTGIKSFTLSAKAGKGVIHIAGAPIVFTSGRGTLKGMIDLPPRALSLRLGVTPSTPAGMPAAALVYVGPVKRPDRYYDLKAVQDVVLKHLEATGAGRISVKDLPPDLRQLLRTPPGK